MLKTVPYMAMVTKSSLGIGLDVPLGQVGGLAEIEIEACLMEFHLGSWYAAILLPVCTQKLCNSRTRGWLCGSMLKVDQAS